MIRRTRALFVTIAFAALVASVGCGSFSASSESSSDIISSPITSLSASSGSSTDGDYRDEVVDFTEAHVQAGGDAGGLLKEVGRISEKYGISDWEKNDTTWTAIGSGLRRAKLSQGKYEAWRGQLTQDPAKAELLDRAFR